MITYKFKRLVDADHNTIIQSYSDEEVSVDCIFDENKDKTHSKMMKTFIKHGEKETKSYTVPYKAMDEFLMDGLDTAEIPQVLMNNTSDQIKEYIITINLGSESIDMKLIINPGEMVIYKKNAFNERWKICKVGNSSEKSSTEIIHNLKDLRKVNMVNEKYDEIAITLFDPSNHKCYSIEEILFYKMESQASHSSIFPNKYGLVKLKDFYIEPDTHHPFLCFHKEKNTKVPYNYCNFEVLEYNEPNELGIKSPKKSKTRIINYHPALFTKYGLDFSIIYDDILSGFIETTEMIVEDGNIVEIDQVFDNITEQEFIKELEKEKTRDERKRIGNDYKG